MRAPRERRDPSRPAFGSADVSAAAERARAQLREEMKELRREIDAMVTEQRARDTALKADDAVGSRLSLLGDGLAERPRSTSAALLGLFAAIGLAIPASVALHQALPLIEGSSNSGPPGGRGSASGRTVTAQLPLTEPLVPGRFGLEFASQNGGLLASGGAGLLPAPLFAIRGLAPVRSGGSHSAGHGHGTPGSPWPTPPHPAPNSETTELISTPPGSGQDGSAGEGGSSQDGGSNGGGKGHGHGPGGPPINAAGQGGQPGNGHGEGGGPHHGDQGHGAPGTHENGPEGPGSGPGGRGHVPQGPSHGHGSPEGPPPGHGTPKGPPADHGDQGAGHGSESGEHGGPPPPPPPRPPSPSAPGSNGPSSAPNGHGPSSGQTGGDVPGGRSGKGN